MAENEDDAPAIKEENDSTADIQQLQHLEDSEEIANDQKKFNKEMLENQRRLLAEMETIQKKLDGRKRKGDDEGLENPAKRADTSTMVSEPPKVPLKTPFKFVIRNVFKDVSKMEENKYYLSANEEYFGVPWYICIRRIKLHIGLYLHCGKSEDIGKWSIETEYDLEIIYPNRKSVTRNVRYTYDKNTGYGNANMMKWEELMTDYLVDDKLIAEAHVTFKKMTGIYKDNLRSFDETMIDVSDVVLVVQDEKFRVSKMYLATHSSYFKTLFLGGFSESEQSEVVLTGIDSYDFQNYLEVVYGELAIDEYAVEGILHVADMYDTPIVIRKCEEFLLKESKKTLKKKLQMSIRYNLNKLKEKCLSEIKTSEDIQSVIPGDINDLEPSLMAALLGKALTLL